MFLFTYRLRQLGAKLDRSTLQTIRPAYGNLWFDGTAGPDGISLARLLPHDSMDADLLPPLRFDRWRITSGVLLIGTEQILTAEEAVEYPQAWFCVVDRLDFAKLPKGL